jgi:hypothetical protein
MREPGFHLTKKIKRHIYIAKLRKEGEFHHYRNNSERVTSSKSTIRMQNKLAKRALRAEKRAIKKQQKESKRDARNV